VKLRGEHCAKSAALLEESGKKSSSKRTGALNVRDFFLADKVEKGNVIIRHCPTDDMIGDFHAKPLQGVKFRKFRDAILIIMTTWTTTGVRWTERKRDVMRKHD